MTNVWTIGPIVWIGLAAVVVAGILFARSVRRARRSGDPSPVINITLVIGAVWAAVSVIGSVIAVLNTLLSPTVTMTVPVAGFWPELPAGVVFGGTTATRLSGGFTDATGGWPEIAGVEDPLRAWLPRAAAMVNVPFWPLAAGLAFAALATIFRYGSRLQRDTDGLV